MSYVLCDVDECAYHDGAGCTLDTVEITRRADLQEQTDGLHRPKRAYCADYETQIWTIGNIDNEQLRLEY